MTESNGTGSSKEWLSEQNMPTASEEQIGKVLAWVIELEAQATKLAEGDYSSAPENTTSRLNASRDARTAINILKWVFPDETGEWERYIDARYQAMKDEITQTTDTASVQE